MLLNLIEKKKQTCHNRMYLYHYKFWFMDVERSKWCFYIGCEFLGRMFKQIIIDLFETLAKSLQNLLKQYGLTKIFLFMLIMKCKFEYHNNYFEVNNKLWNFGCDEKLSWDLYFGHDFSKAYQYATIEKRVLTCFH